MDHRRRLLALLPVLCLTVSIGFVAGHITKGTPAAAQTTDPCVPDERVPATLTTGLTDMDKELDDILADGHLTRDRALERIRGLKDRKRSLVSENFPPVFGRSFWDLYLTIKSIDEFLEEARHHAYNDEGDMARRDLRSARNAKKELELMLAESPCGTR
ncbi:MAG: hypothetical protein WD004_00230 [Actinomycetota bacterium]